MSNSYVYRVLTNPIYIGKIVHKNETYPGLHKPIIDNDTWEKARAINGENPRLRAAGTRKQTPSLLAGLIRGPDGAMFSPTHTRKRNRLYRYYVSQTILKHGAGTCPVGRIPAGEIEANVIAQLRAVFRQPEIVAEAWRNAAHDKRACSEQDIHAALKSLDPLWDELFPAEQARIAAIIIDRIDVSETDFNLHLRVDGLCELAQDLKSRPTLRKDAA